VFQSSDPIVRKSLGPNIWLKMANLTICLFLSGRRGVQHREDENPGAFQQDLGGRTHCSRGLVPTGFQVKKSQGSLGAGVSLSSFSLYLPGGGAVGVLYCPMRTY
jgi:hypothetical protein